jgi:hypothetical protein
MHPAWWIRAPPITRLVVAPILVRSARISRDVGLMSKLTCGAVCRPATIAAAIAKSRSPGLALDPITACAISCPATSRTGTTLPGEDGLAISGSISDRSMASWMS